MPCSLEIRPKSRYNRNCNLDFYNSYSLSFTRCKVNNYTKEIKTDSFAKGYGYANQYEMLRCGPLSDLHLRSQGDYQGNQQSAGRKHGMQSGRYPNNPERSEKSGAYHRTARNRRSSFMYGSLPNHSFPNLYCPGARWASFSHRYSPLPESSVSGSQEYQESTADPLPQSRGCHQGSHGTNHFTVHDRRIPSIGKPVGLV